MIYLAKQFQLIQTSIILITDIRKGISHPNCVGSVDSLCGCDAAIVNRASSPVVAKSEAPVFEAAAVVDLLCLRLRRPDLAQMLRQPCE